MNNALLTNLDAMTHDLRRAFAASKRIPNAPGPVRKAKIHAWAEFVKQALRDEDVSQGRRE